MSTTKCRILYIDDHEDSAEMLRVLLSEDEDYEVITASSVRAALELIRTETFDLYVLHHNLTDGTGIELCSKLHEETTCVPCIFYSGDAYELHRQQALAAGADDYIPKPNIEKLIDSVGKLLAERECATAG